jgi:hypothetical protein
MESPFALHPVLRVIGKSVSEEHATRANAGGMGSDCGGDQRGQNELRTAARLARKQQLRGTGKQSQLRSDSSMQEVAERVQFKEFMEVIRAGSVT